ncbi:hypothetical protein GCM10009555_078700 [Acrocarpospora macrocephala]|uniref:Uncharacterized protein n=2 Tax=Acrocarpospora macrocephala TaxID=150177 RepID=A0A5M3X9T4_9ACTN|nr:hypothetical protein Amac_098690 [Acrocarpospora macrocephala]
MWMGRLSLSSVKIAVIFLILVVTTALTTFLLYLREDGGTIATVLAIPLGIAAIVAPIVSQWATQASEGNSGQHPTVRAVILIVGIPLIVLLLLTVTWLLAARHSDLPVHFGSPTRLDEEKVIMLEPRVDEDRWPAGDLSFTPKLATTQTLGDCLLPAELLITPMVDGHQLPQQTVQHDQEISIPIPEDSRKVGLGVRLKVPGNQGCVLDLTLARGTLVR